MFADPTLNVLPNTSPLSAKAAQEAPAKPRIVIISAALAIIFLLESLRFFCIFAHLLSIQI